MTDRKTLEDLAREAANAIEDEWAMCGLTGGLYEDYAVEVAKRVAALIRAQALDEAAAVCDGFNWFEVEGCDPDGAPPFLAERIRALKEST